MAKTRLAFIGAGSHATEALYPNIPLIPDCELVAVCDLIEERANRVAAAYGATAYTDMRAMLDEAELDAVCICGPPELHHEAALAALGRKLPVFVEKPPAPTFRQAVELARRAEARGVFGVVGFMKRFAPANVVAREYAESPTFGGLASVLLVHAAGPYDEARRMLLYNGIHTIDQARFFGGEIDAVHAHAYVSKAGVQVLACTLLYASGVVGQMNINSGGTWTDCYEQTYLVGRSAQINIVGCREVELMSPNGRFARGPGVETFGWSNRYHVSGTMSQWAAGAHYTRGYYGVLAHFVAAVRRQVQPSPSFAEGMAAMRLVEALLLSQKDRRVVKVEEIRVPH